MSTLPSRLASPGSPRDRIRAGIRSKSLRRLRCLILGVVDEVVLPEYRGLAHAHPVLPWRWRYRRPHRCCRGRSSAQLIIEGAILGAPRVSDDTHSLFDGP